ncbi:MAG: DUF2779 domain-containing protein [Bacteroidetes bacterium]|nr:DUF2779 domain-containing protein [Bacteroidota bacterium]
MAFHQLSKSSFIKGLQCEKHLYLYKHHYELMDTLSEIQKAVFSRGTNIGILAQKLFPEGIDTSPRDVRQTSKAVEQTDQFIKNGASILYEAAFIYDEVMVYCDIISLHEGKWQIFEVKSSTGISETYLWDAAVQYYVLRGAGYEIEDISIVYINNEYVRQGEVNLDEFFTVESVLADIQSLLPVVQQNVRKFKGVLNRPEMPDIEIGEYCTNPYRCSFFNYCWKKIPENSVFDISNMHFKKKMELYRDGIIKLDDIPNDYPLSKNYKIQVDAFKSGESLINKEAIKEFLEDFEYPLYFMDFESFQPAIPLYDNSKPYQQIPFQYSVHILTEPDAELKHYEFLADPNEEPRKPFIEHLLHDLGDHGSIVVYNKSFEIGRLNEIVRDFPEHLEAIERIVERIVDLMVPFQKKYYYKPEMQGSYSIKYVLPALLPELSYENMEIGDGATASVSYELLREMDDMFEIEKIRNNLLEYSKLDTYAMVRIYQKLIQEIDL